MEEKSEKISGTTSNFHLNIHQKLRRHSRSKTTFSDYFRLRTPHFKGENKEKCTFLEKKRQNIWRFEENVVPLQSQTDKECTTRESATRLAPFKSSRA